MVRISHDDTGCSPAWFLEEVRARQKVRRPHNCPAALSYRLRQGTSISLLCCCLLACSPCSALLSILHPVWVVCGSVCGDAGWVCSALCCAVLCCAVLCRAVRRCAVLCCVVPCCAVPCCTKVCCAVIGCALPCCAVLLADMHKLTCRELSSGTTSTVGGGWPERKMTGELADDSPTHYCKRPTC